MAETNGTGRMNACYPTGGGAIITALFTADMRLASGDIVHVPLALMGDGRALVWDPELMAFDVRDLDEGVREELRHIATQQHRIYMAGALMASQEIDLSGAH